MFDPRNPVTIRGIVTQAVTPIRPPAPDRYFRIDATSEGTGIVRPWAIAVWSASADSMIRVGETVTVTGTGSRDGTRRLSLDNVGPTPNINGVPLSNLRSP